MLQSVLSCTFSLIEKRCITHYVNLPGHEMTPTETVTELAARGLLHGGALRDAYSAALILDLQHAMDQEQAMRHTEDATADLFSTQMEMTA